MRSVSFLLLTVVLSVIAFVGCGGSTSATSQQPPPPPPPPPPTTGSLYAINGITSSVLRFSAAANGAVSPQAAITGPATQIQGYANLLVDSTNDRLFVSDFQTASVLIFDHPSTKNGNVAPDRVLSGALTTFNLQQDLALDSANNQLYVQNGSGNNILVFAPASTINGNVAPTRTINLGFQPSRIALDAGSNRLFVVNGASIMVYDNASTLSGSVVASRTISGPSTQLAPAAIKLDSSGRLFVVNGTRSILVFPNAGAASGNVAPSTVVAGSNTMLFDPIDLAVSPAGEIFVVQMTNGVLVFAPAASVNGNVSPVRSIPGNSTTGLFTTPGIGNVSSIAVDPSH